MVEVEKARQIENEGFRRWFSDDDCDLILWYPSRDAVSPEDMVGFQFCYGKKKRELALTWKAGGSAVHTAVDDGEAPYGSKMSPILVSDGSYDGEEAASFFLRSAGGLESRLASFIEEKLRAARP